MQIVRRIVDKYHRDGLAALVRRGASLLSRDLVERARMTLFRFRLVLFGDTVVTHHGIEIDVMSPGITADVRAEIVRERDYELKESLLCQKYVEPGTDVVEFGGGIGFVACSLDRSRSGARHLVFEPNSALIETIERHRSMNGCGFEIYNRAYAPTDGAVELYRHDDFRSSSTRSERAPSAAEPESVDATSLSTLVSEFGLDQFALVVDMEGAELELVLEEGDVLADHCRVLVVEFHDFVDEPVDDVRRRLSDRGFSRVDRVGRIEVYVNEAL